ncbi:MAG: CvpA family protein [Planctomycetes bacterium]|nr:CvpA family protein [Planctomycetota bacterium]
MVLSILALVAMAAIAYAGALDGLHRAARTLVALVLAGVIAFGLFGPVTGALFASADDPRSTWYYAADALCLWAILCVVFLGLRLLAGRFLRNQADIPVLIHRIGGGAVGAITGYLAAGVCLAMVQMLPVSPALFGYEPFRYVEGTSEENPERVVQAGRLWLDWDRQALGFFGYLSGAALGSPEASLYERYGDVYETPGRPSHPADRLRGSDRPPADADDFLYYHWYRRYEAVRWRTGVATGPIPEVPAGAADEHGLILRRGKSTVLYGMNLSLSNVTRAAALENFPDVRTPGGAGDEFLLVTLRLKVVDRVPRTIDSAQFHLLDSLGGKVGGAPLVSGPAKRDIPRRPPADESELPPPQIVAGNNTAEVAHRRLRFGFATGKPRGMYLMDGATFTFTERRQSENRTLIFVVPKAVRDEDIRLFMDPTVPPPPEPAPPAGPAPPAPAPG